MLYHLLVVLHAAILAYSPPTIYYVSSTGNDSNNGLSSQTAWKSLAKINHTDFSPGDKILLEGGKTFKGNLVIDSLDSGEPGQYVEISAYGKGYATVHATNKDGLFGNNCSYVKVSNLIFKGDGVGKNEISGIHFFSNSTKQPSHVQINRCRTEGFTRYGILFGAEDREGVKGYDSVRIESCTATNNGEAGISSYGSQTRFSHSNFYINDSKAFLNRGNPKNPDHHTGNGIVMSSVENLLIEHCEAYENGSNNRSTAGGPVGIWVWICKRATIQYCVSHHNKAGATKDGGGFDIDGGSSDCIIQYNYSHDNEGAGYLLAEYGSVMPFTNNTIRFNVSRNDGRKNSYGAITLWGADTNFRVNNSYVYNNSIFVDNTNISNGKPCAVHVMGKNMKGVVITNNIFSIGKSAHLYYSSEDADSSQVHFLSNKIDVKGQLNITWNKTNYHSIPAWQIKAIGQERWKGKPFNLSLLNIDKGSKDAKGKNISKTAADFFGAEYR